MRFLSYLTLFLLVSCSHINTYYDRYDHLVVVGTNDFHGYLRPNETEVSGQKVISGGAEWISGYMQILERKFGDHLLLLDAGDIFQGTLDSNYYKGKSVMAFYNLLPYRAAAVGNHEFDYGPREEKDLDLRGALKDRMQEAKFPFVQANIFQGKKLWVETNLYPSVMVKAGEYKVGIIGLTTVSTPNKTFPKYVEDLQFHPMLEPLMEEAKKLRLDGADIVLVTAHEGEADFNSVLKELPSGLIDAAVAGHTHTEMHDFVNGIPVIQSKTKGLYFGRVDLYVDRSTKKINTSLTKIQDMHAICGNWFATIESCDVKEAKGKLEEKILAEVDLFPLRPAIYEGMEVLPDLSVREVLKPYFEQLNSKKQEVLVEASQDLDWLPSGESVMADLLLDGLKWKFPEAKVFYTNGGGIRKKLSKGAITYGDLFEMHPFDNFGVLVKITGKKLKELFRVGVSGAQSIPTFKGVEAVYHKGNAERYLRDINGDGKKETWERDRLVSLVWEGTKRPVKDSEEFWLATNDYLVSGGDNVSHVFGDIPSGMRKYSSVSQRDIAADYLRKVKPTHFPAKEPMRLKAIP